MQQLTHSFRLNSVRGIIRFCVDKQTVKNNLADNHKGCPYIVGTGFIPVRRPRKLTFLQPVTLRYYTGWISKSNVVADL